MVFGVFDGIHGGHLEMLKEAKGYGDYLIVVVAQDHIVKHLKGEYPRVNLLERFKHLSNVDGVDKVVVGDAHLSSWQVVKRYEPNVIAVGYDQDALKADLEKNLSQLKQKPEIVVLSSFEPETHKSSNLPR